jgi:hypothetical protein
MAHRGHHFYISASAPPMHGDLPGSGRHER